MEIDKLDTLKIEDNELKFFRLIIIIKNLLYNIIKQLGEVYYEVRRIECRI